MKKVKLFCIPYSGGSAATYYKWSKKLGDHIELIPVELQGRGKRMKEPFYTDLWDAVNDICKSIMNQLSEGDEYAIFGHSMGALLVYEVYYRLKELGIQEPVHIFFSGRKPPYDESIKTNYHKLPDEEFLHVVYNYGGNTKHALKDDNLLKLFLPILRADFRIAETYKYSEKDSAINCDITVLSGTEDGSVTSLDAEGWKTLINGTCNVEMFRGTHFFIIEVIEEVVAVINKALQK